MDIHSNDAEIISEAQTGNGEAFELLYRKHARQVYRTALAILGSAQTAEEVLQDCFVRAYKHLHALNADPSVSPWLHRVAVKLCYSSLRRNLPSRWTVSLESVSDYFFPTATPSPEEGTHRSEIQAALREGIAWLSLPYRSVIVLHYLQGFSLEEIAYILGCPVGTVKSRLFHARKKLGQQLAGLRLQPVYEAA